MPTRLLRSFGFAIFQLDLIFELSDATLLFNNFGDGRVAVHDELRCEATRGCKFSMRLHFSLAPFFLALRPKGGTSPTLVGKANK